MKRRIPGLHEQSSGSEIPDGIFLVRVEHASYQYHPHKPYFALRLAVLQPQTWAQKTISGRIYCSQKALWKLSWFLRDFGYDLDGFAPAGEWESFPPAGSGRLSGEGAA